ncbi:MAG TPA: hypothetical protein VGR81_12435 [Candidatus Acidoferrales bacterium]|nr:hypothetical protein [Candidatus Acidoferrales bacterium]
MDIRKYASLFTVVFIAANMAWAQDKIATLRRPANSDARSNTDFFAAADEVLQVMSKILALPVKTPVKESIRTKAEIREYLVAQDKKDESAKKHYADQRTLEAFGLIPKGFPLDAFLLSLLTDQVAGLYDPDKKEFYIADWIDPVEQKPVMAHELTHALDDEYFHLKKWQKGAEANDDASLAREAVIEGSAVASMMDYSLSDLHTSVRQIPDIAPFIESGLAADMDTDPNLAKAPPFIRDELLFPYLQGAEFSQAVLKSTSGWADFKKVFENPPVSTQQILHPKLYFDEIKPRKITLPRLKRDLPDGYEKLDENVVGEFALGEILKQFIGPGDADEFAPMWDGDRYAVFENKDTKQTILVVLLAIDNAKDTGAFFGAYRDALEKKHGIQKPDNAGPEFMAAGDVYLRCVKDECLSVEGAERSVDDRIVRELSWPAENAQRNTTNRRSGGGSSLAGGRR